MSCPSFATITDGSPAGLTAAEAQRRLREFGPNATPEEPTRPLRLFASKFLAPVPCLLEAAIVLQLVLGEYVEASIIAVLLVFNAALGFLHESRAQATIAALKSRLALNASVRRDGEWKTIPAAELVAGDLIKLSLGSVVAADASLVQGFVLLDQSMLTGESLPIEAEAGHETYAGALVRRGEALARVTATGSRTKFGRTAELVRTAHATSSQQKAIFRIVRNLAVFNGAVCTLMIGYAFLIGMPIREMLRWYSSRFSLQSLSRCRRTLFWRPRSARRPWPSVAYCLRAFQRSTKPERWMSYAPTRPERSPKTSSP
ncbi:MAG: cation-transporting P-type ATPase [Xanthobacteraceae bacterium]